MFDRIRAELFCMTQKAVLPCGCTGVMMGHHDNSVQFGIERSSCDVHEQATVPEVDKDDLDLLPRLCLLTFALTARLTMQDPPYKTPKNR